MKTATSRLLISALAEALRLRMFRSFCYHLIRSSRRRAMPFCGALNVCYGLGGRFYVCWETTRHAHAQLPFCFRRSSGHHGLCALRVLVCPLLETPKLRPLVCCRKQRVPDLRVHPIPTEFTPHALALTPGPAPYCRGSRPQLLSSCAALPDSTV